MRRKIVSLIVMFLLLGSLMVSLAPSAAAGIKVPGDICRNLWCP